MLVFFLIPDAPTILFLFAILPHIGFYFLYSSLIGLNDLRLSCEQNCISASSNSASSDSGSINLSGKITSLWRASSTAHYLLLFVHFARLEPDSGPLLLDVDLSGLPPSSPVNLLQVDTKIQFRTPNVAHCAHTAQGVVTHDARRF